MRCEVCGREIRGPPFRRVIEGGRLTVCAQCAHFGTAEWTPSVPRAPPKMRQPRSEFEALERLTLVDGYGDMIRVARQRENMTVDVLAKKIAEKESVVKNLEKEELVPDRALIQKLRNVLKIELLVPEESAPAPKASKPSAERTLGDLIKQKQSAKAESQGTEELEEG